MFLLTASAVLLNLLTLGILSWKNWNTGRDQHCLLSYNQ
jgi:hypothetical protein